MQRLERLKLRILIISSWRGGGVGSHIESLIRGLKERGHEVVFPSRCIPTQLFGLNGLVIDALACLNKNLFFIYLSIISAFLHLLLLKYKCDLHHVHDVITCNLMNWPRKSRKPVFLTVHAYFAYEALAQRFVSKIFRGSKSTKARGNLLEIERKAYQSADVIVTVDTRLKQHVHSLGIAKEKIFVIYNSVDTELFHPPSLLEREQCRTKLGIKANQFIITCSRVLVKKNGVKYFILAAEEVIRNGINAQFLIAGDGPERANLQNIVRSKKLHQHIKFLGQVPHEQVASLIIASDVVVVPSISIEGVQEATSISALEAMAVGIPVIASDIGGLREIIVNKKTGILVPEKKSEFLAKKIIEVINNPTLRKNLSHNSITYIIKHRSYKGMTQYITKCYGHALDKKVL